MYILLCYIVFIQQVGIFLNVLSLIKLCRGFGAVKRVGLKIPWLNAFEGSIPSSGIFIFHFINLFGSNLFDHFNSIAEN